MSEISYNEIRAFSIISDRKEENEWGDKQDEKKCAGGHDKIESLFTWVKTGADKFWETV